MQTQTGPKRSIDLLIAQAEMDRMARLFMKRRNRGREQTQLRNCC